MNQPTRQWRAVGWTILLIVHLASLSAAVENRFPRPDFSSGYESPATEVPVPRPDLHGLIDVGLLGMALLLASLLILRWRQRYGIVALTIGALLYFGFWRNGCICPIGAIQNAVAALTDSGYIIPVSVVFIFLLPIVFALFAGRVFCGGVCPLGAIQELVVVRPLHLPRWLNKVLGLGRYWVLGLVVFAAGTGIGFVICRTDPFVGFFRMGGAFSLLLVGAGLLLLGTVIGRPYCRFLCPYAILLEWASRLSWKRTSITPADCINCRLCEDACPYDAIEKPELEEKQSKSGGPRPQRVLGLLFLAIPVLVVIGWIGGGKLGPWIGRVHPTNALARAVFDDDGPTDLMTRDRMEAFQGAGLPREALAEEAASLHRKLIRGGRLLGAYCGLVLGLQLVFLSRRISHDDYRPDPAACVSCGRCYRYCPVPKPIPKSKRGRSDGGNGVP